MTPNRTALTMALFAAVAALAAAILPASAAAAPGLLWQAPPNGETGSGAGRIDSSAGIVADPSSGHVYVADHRNARIDEFDAWGQFVKAWGWGVRDGAPEPQTCGPGATPSSATCVKGIPGSGPGQFGEAFGGPQGGIALDPAGHVYVGDMENLRVEKFDPAGNFLSMFGGGVDKTTNGNVCTAASICGAGTSGEGDGQFNSPGTNGFGRYIATGPAGTIFVGDAKGRIQEFEASGAFKAKVTLEGELASKTVESLAVEGAGSLYVKAAGDRKHVYKFSPAGALLSTIAVELAAESPLALDAAGNLYAVGQFEKPHPDNGVDIGPQEVIAFGPDGTPVIPAGSGFAVQKESEVNLNGLATNTVTATGGVDVYVTNGSTPEVGKALVSAYGPPPDKWPPPVKAPQITSQYAVSVDVDSTLLQAQINPFFWADTSYYVEYGTGRCSEGGCSQQQPAPPGTQLGGGVIGSPVTTKGTFLSGLLPGTTYHYRFVARSGGGGPVHGIGAGEEEGVFITPSLPQPPNSSCANAAFRGGASGRLPDCRAYEMVSPVDKNGGDIVGICDIQCYRTEINQASVDGEKFTYSSYKAFGDAVSNPYANQYIASRGPEGGWTTHSISPPYTAGLFGGLDVYATETEFKAFSPDLASAWLVDSSRFTLTPDAVEGFVNAYRQETTDGSLTALTTTEPQPAQSQSYQLELVGHSADGAHAILAAAAALTPDAAAGVTRQLYDFAGGELHLVSVLPDGTASPDSAMAGTGTPAGNSIHGTNRLEHAVSADGSRIFWSAAKGSGNTGTLYVRLNPTQPQSTIEGGKCKQPAKACTIVVSSGDSAQFWSAAADGSKALFSEGSLNEGKVDLYRFDVGAKARTLIAHGVLGVLGASDNLSYVYFASTESLAAGAVAGERNLYLYRDGTITYVATLSRADTTNSDVAGFTAASPSVLSPAPILRATRVTPDGRHLAFISTNGPTGYDSTDAVSGKADSEVYLYDAGAQRLSCASCNPTGARPHGGEMKSPYTLKGAAGFETGRRVGAWINTSENSLYSPHVLSDDGERLFFNSFDALVPRDTNGAQDVYQWEAPGSGDCGTESAAFSASNDGCISLISTGESPEVSEFVDATPNGSDVFFKTTASIDPEDPGLIDVYDARVGGGSPPPPIPPTPCVGDACQSVPAPPNDPTPASASFRGAGDPSAVRGCPRGKHRVSNRGKSRCVAKKQRKGKRQHKRRDQRNHGRAAR